MAQKKTSKKKNRITLKEITCPKPSYCYNAWYITRKNKFKAILMHVVRYPKYKAVVYTYEKIIKIGRREEVVYFEEIFIKTGRKEWERYITPDYPNILLAHNYTRNLLEKLKSKGSK